MSGKGLCLCDIQDSEGQSLPRSEEDKCAVTCVQPTIRYKGHLNRHVCKDEVVTACVKDREGNDYQYDGEGNVIVPVHDVVDGNGDLLPRRPNGDFIVEIPPPPVIPDPLGVVNQAGVLFPQDPAGNFIVPDECVTLPDGTVRHDGKKIGVREKRTFVNYVEDSGLINTVIFDDSNGFDDFFDFGEYTFEVCTCEAEALVRVDLHGSLVLSGPAGETGIIDWIVSARVDGATSNSIVPPAGTERICKPAGCMREESTLESVNHLLLTPGTHTINPGYHLRSAMPAGFEVFAALGGFTITQQELFCCGG